MPTYRFRFIETPTSIADYRICYEYYVVLKIYGSKRVYSNELVIARTLVLIYDGV